MISSIELLAGASIEQMTSQRHVYQVKTSEAKTVSIVLSAPHLEAEGLYLQTWGSSYLLANRLYAMRFDLNEARNLQVLELGSGTGLVGLSAAIVWGARVMLTDFASIVPGTATNVALNQSLLDQTGGSATCGSLEWLSPENLGLVDGDGKMTTVVPSPETRAQVIVSADTLYTDEQPELLSRAIMLWLQRTASAGAIVCYPLRIGSLDGIREFWQLMERGGLEAVDHGQERIEGEDWDDEKLHEWSVWKWKAP